MINKNNQGFTVLELVIVLAAAGALMSAYYVILNRTLGLSDNIDRMERVQWGLAEHFRITGYFPCPAPLDAAPDDADYAIPKIDAGNNCDAADSGITRATETIGGETFEIFIGAVPTTALNEAADCESGANVVQTVDGNLLGAMGRSLFRSEQKIENPNALADDSIHNYSVQNTKCIPPEFMADDHGNKYFYAVTAAATNPNVLIDAMDPDAGHIRIVDQTPGPPFNDATENRVLYAIVSAGEDARGAFNQNGIQQGTACLAAPGLDRENCDLSNTTFRSMPISTSGDANHFDDTIEFSLAGSMREDNLWQLKEGDIAGQRNIYLNRNANHLAIGDDVVVNPGDMLVTRGGDMSVSSGDVITNQDVEASRNVEGSEVFGGEAAITQRFCYDTACDGLGP